MQRSPAHDPALIYASLEQGRLDDAERMARRNLADAPEDEASHLLLAMTLQQADRHDEALIPFTRLTQLRPATTEHWSNLGTALRRLGRLEDAETTYATALRLAPHDAMLHFNLGLLRMERAEYVRARENFLDAVRLEAQFPEARIYGAMMCYECGDNPNAERLIEPWRRWRDLGAEMRTDLAWLMVQLGDTDNGERLLQEAKADPSQHLRVLALLVQLRERVNRLDEARELADQLPDPETVDDAALRSEIISAQSALAGRGKDLAQARGLLERLIALTDNERKRSNTYFSLGHVCDKQGDYTAAFDAFRHAHASQLQTAGEVVPELLDAGMEPLRIATYHLSDTQAANWTRLDAPSVDDSPIFVVGFPRSGTTMLEQMLDAHPGMQSMDERAFLQGVIERMQGFGMAYPERIGELDQAQTDALRATYWTLSRKITQLEPGQRLVDKNPLNMLRLPMIYRLFPNAKVVLCLRHPCDVLMSCYMQSFRSPNFAILCSSLERLARGYVNAMKFWIHHAALLKPDLLIWRYEDALDDFPREVRRAGDFLDLADSAPLAHFHEHARAKGFISTPSYHQVVEPPNKKALGRWRHYESHFAGALPILDPILKHWHYDV